MIPPRVVGAPGGAPALRMVAIPLSALRYGEGVTVPGSEPEFNLYVPVFERARRFDVDAIVRLPANVSPGARVELLAGGRPLASELAGTRRQLELRGSIPAAHDRPGIVFTIRARLALDVIHCEPGEVRSLYLFVAPETKVTVAEDPAPPASVAGFFEGYDARFAVTADAKASAKTKLARLALGYGIHRVVRWRVPSIALTQTPDAAARTIVVGDFAQDLRLEGGRLYASPAGVAAITAARARLVIGSAAERAEESASPDPRRVLSLDTLGIGTRSATGTGTIVFPVDTSLAIFRGRPSGLRFIIDLTHSALDEHEYARLDVLAAGVILNSFTLSRAGGRDRFDVPIDDRYIRAAQNLVVRIEYLPRTDVCGAANALNVAMLGSSHFAWSKTADVAPSVGDFFDGAYGTLDVGVQDDAVAPATFALLDHLGNINPAIRAVSVRTLGDPPASPIDASIEAGSTEELGKALPLAIASSGDGYAVTDGGGTIVFRAAGSDAFGVLQTFAADPPKLALTYAGSPAALAAVKSLPLAALTQAGNDVLVFTGARIAYTKTAEIARARTLPPPFAKRALPMIFVAAVILLALLLVVVRRARRVS